MAILFTSMMSRKSTALAIVLLLAVLAPATAIIGFCTRMPCCSHAASETMAALSTERTDCCTTITCYESPSANLANRVASADAGFAAPALVAVAPTTAAPTVTAQVIDTSPPASARQRLAALSVLRI
ncbi:MAG TPA: hypothetical protein VH087_17085 [Thermoanaerobaculia bacterium]|jgi:hypothetical protein|nr:hypothetical protein [Thermoanaerobaculia bacterium]